MSFTFLKPTREGVLTDRIPWTWPKRTMSVWPCQPWMGRSRFHSDLMLKWFMKRNLKEKRAQKFRVLPTITLEHRGKIFELVGWAHDSCATWLWFSGQSRMPKTMGESAQELLSPQDPLLERCFQWVFSTFLARMCGTQGGLQIYINSISFRIPNLQVRSITQWQWVKVLETCTHWGK